MVLSVKKLRTVWQRSTVDRSVAGAHRQPQLEAMQAPQRHEEADQHRRVDSNEHPHEKVPRPSPTPTAPSEQDECQKATVKYPKQSVHRRDVRSDAVVWYDAS